jgi:hypothetical protein
MSLQFIVITIYETIIDEPDPVMQVMQWLLNL